jgi:hypothetical protein
MINFHLLFSSKNSSDYQHIIYDFTLIRNVLYRIVHNAKEQINEDKYKFTEFEIFKIIQHTNKYILWTKTLIDIDTYLEAVHDTFFSELNIGFKNKLSEIFQSKIFYPIDHEELETFGILFNIDNHIGNVTKLIKRYNFIEDQDYIKIKRNEENKYRPDIDYIPSEKLTTYYFTNNTFKKILLRSRNNDKYIDYYLLLERVVYYYNDYIHKAQDQIIKTGEIKFTKYEMISENEIYQLKNDNERLERQYEEINNTCFELRDKNDDLRGYEEMYDEESDKNIKLKKELKELKDNKEYNNEGLQKENDQLRKAIEKLHDKMNDFMDEIQDLELEIDRLKQENGEINTVQKED